jgi:hypothetical protein
VRLVLVGVSWKARMGVGTWVTVLPMPGQCRGIGRGVEVAVSGHAVYDDHVIGAPDCGMIASVPTLGICWARTDCSLAEISSGHGKTHWIAS